MSNSITVSVDDKSNVIIGQVLIIDIIFKSDSNIPTNSQFELKNIKNATASNTFISIINSDDNFSMTTELYIDKNISTGDIVSFDIVPNEHAVGFSTKKINYTAHEVDLDSLGIYFEEDVIPALMTDEVNIPPNGKSYTRAIAMVKNRNGYPLAEVPITIIGGYLPNLGKVKIFLSNQNPNTEVSKQPLYGEQSIVLNTDKNGKLEFYIYLSDKSQFVLDLKARVSGKTDFVFSRNRLYILDSNQGSPFAPDKERLAPPRILGYTGDKLMGDETSSTFSVAIGPYSPVRKNDIILFFVDGKYSYQQVTVKNIEDLDSFSIDLPYTIFPENKTVTFSYVVFTENKNMQYSVGTYVLYGGGGKNQPLDNVTRVYDMCTVYSSFGPSTSSNLVFPNDTVNYFTISRYMNNKGHDGLFVVITGTNDPTDKTKVPFGSTVTLTLRIDSYKVPVYKTFTQTMPTKSDQGSKNTATLTFNIPYKDVSHIISYPNGSAGRIYFDYQVNELGKITYGKIWEAKIDTVPPSPDGDPDEGGSN
ncbi:hypothetical protein [Xenorhabdus bovienii]|uniref:Uncharacterized protein n=1 Tax=Xenorhabdus bovienii str. Intermedium TaxID=1379677 RepID=A0A077QP09_XENBV|nr:hypothetical protein [Xenorhabdus bovienii]CDH33991.1 hypothetical protein XBI1_2810070 [Xenorhabdus bovienii str. Intermedium]